MEVIINKLRKNKKLLRRLSKLIKSCVDMEEEIIDPITLEELHIISIIDEELTKIIYLIIENKNS